MSSSEEPDVHRRCDDALFMHQTGLGYSIGQLFELGAGLAHWGLRYHGRSMLASSAARKGTANGHAPTLTMTRMMTRA
jgi:hypothetical protein